MHCSRESQLPLLLQEVRTIYQTCNQCNDYDCSSRIMTSSDTLADYCSDSTAWDANVSWYRMLPYRPRVWQQRALLLHPGRGFVNLLPVNRSIEQETVGQTCDTISGSLHTTRLRH
jgi:hypothetical protein